MINVKKTVSKKFYMKVISCMLILSFISPMLNVNTYAQESKLAEAPVFIDNKAVRTKYIMRDGHMLVPSLFFKHTGIRVDWNEEFRSAVFRYGSTYFALPVGTNYSDDYMMDTGTWQRSILTSKTVEFNGELFVPLVDVARKFGMTVRYDPTVARTFITTNIPVPQNVIYRGDPNKKLVALTFDDGPEDYYTKKILDILKEKNAPATFFVLGKQVEEFPTMMKRIVDEGHGIANHTWNHPLIPNIGTDKLIEEVRSTQQIMAKTVGRQPDIIRPPFGAFTKSDAIVLNQMGMRIIMWSVDTLDWSGLSGDEIVNIVHKDVTPGGIILQHNFQSDARLLDGTIDALPRIIDELREKGYKFVTVQTLLDSR
ncbi:polysaccharide deacetylase family protein [Bacillus sp. FJAT-45350]|uniref:polysaccharide deacetylase family protein n=1 Tax=Bacillus sp. FJAT-45350 TaxID=2011014 RepID=UPI00211CE3DF|nr:polysaccharide deacetylase family protein [Bacillus sp. FJAT-45350]